MLLLELLQAIEEARPLPARGHDPWRLQAPAELDTGGIDDRAWQDLVLHARGHSTPDPRAPYEQWRDKRRFLMSFGEPEVFPTRAMLLRFAQLEALSPNLSVSDLRLPLPEFTPARGGKARVLSR